MGHEYRDYSRESCPTVKNVLLLDSEGKRVAVKYYSDDWPTHASKLAFEKSVYTKTLKTNARSEAEITMFDGYIVVYKFIHDLHFFVTAGEDENELILASVLQGFTDSVALLLRNDVEKRTALENLDLILLCIDEIVDGGIVLETDANNIAGKVATNAVDGAVPFSEQTISQALATAREHLAREEGAGLDKGYGLEEVELRKAQEQKCCWAVESSATGCKFSTDGLATNQEKSPLAERSNTAPEAIIDADVEHTKTSAEGPAVAKGPVR